MSGQGSPRLTWLPIMIIGKDTPRLSQGALVSDPGFQEMEDRAGTLGCLSFPIMSIWAEEGFPLVV